MCLRVIFVSTLFLFAGARAPSQLSERPPLLTVCEAVEDLKRYAGKTVIVVGRYSESEEGAWLSEECGLRIRNGGLDFRPSISTTYVLSDFAPPPSLPAGFKWDEPAMRQKLQQVMRTTELQVLEEGGDRWVAMFGRLETELARNSRIGDGGYSDRIGFGHLSGAPAQLVGPERGLYPLAVR